ncbi:MAG: hypothetical protein KY463_01705 [Actinobacteria bacterium]|nr:hypothetical protein [Actinomycetota bacterium]
MEILLVLIVLAIIAAAAFLYMRSRGGGPALSRRGQGPALRGRRTSAAAGHDPMADAVERHARATDPHEAAEAELRLQAQANRVASDLHAQQASELESHARGRGRRGGRRATHAADTYDQPGYDGAGRPVGLNGQPAYEDGRQPLPEQEGGPAYHDEHGRPVYPEDRPRY